jgi:hypothetical protein
MSWRRKSEKTLNITGMKVELQSLRIRPKRRNAEKIFFKEEYNLEMNFSGITTDKTTN